MKRMHRLDSLRVVTPCPVAWTSMVSLSDDDRVRFCAHCQKNVYNVATLAPEEALALVDKMEGGLCMRLSRRPDGTLVTGDCRARLRYARRRGRVAFVCALVVVFAAQVWTQAFGLRALFELVWRPTTPRVAAGAVVLPRQRPTPPAPVSHDAFRGEVTMGLPSPSEEQILAGLIGPPPPHKARRK